jgi:predicted metal-binding membrane protein
MGRPDLQPNGAVKIVLMRDQWIVLGCLLASCALAWWWLIDVQASGRAHDMPEMDGMEMSGMDMGAMALSASPQFGPTFLMWFIMMIAMMLPSAAPMVLLYQRFADGARRSGGGLMPTALFALLYLAVWGGFSLLASAAQVALSDAGVVDMAGMAIGSSRIAGGLLIAAALYQLTPAKRACLENCRSPLSFLRREWAPGWSNAIRLGLKHGAYCVGCCWLLMSLLFVGGVMNLAWIAIIALIVLIEKVTPAPAVTRWAIAAAALGGGIYLLLA